MKRRMFFDVFLFLAGCIGLFASCYAYWIHRQISIHGKHKVQCDVSETMRCSDVIGSEWGEFLGIPLGAFGAGYFLGLLVFALFPIFRSVSLKWMFALRLGYTLPGALVSVLLFLISRFKIGILCPVCLIIQLTCVLSFFYVLLRFVQTRKGSYASDPEGFFWIVVSVSLALSFPLLISILDSSLVF